MLQRTDFRFYMYICKPTGKYLLIILFFYLSLQWRVFMLLDSFFYWFEGSALRMWCGIKKKENKTEILSSKICLHFHFICNEVQVHDGYCFIISDFQKSIHSLNYRKVQQGISSYLKDGKQRKMCQCYNKTYEINQKFISFVMRFSWYEKNFYMTKIGSLTFTTIYEGKNNNFPFS